MLTSPGGFVHCRVRDEGERVRPAPVVGPRGGRALLDQVCLDTPSALLAAERDYWTRLTGWPAHRAGEFEPLDRPAGFPLRIMLQELEDDDPWRPVSAHLDLACGDARATVAAEHVDLGAEVVDTARPWTVMCDPVGMLYCLTPRDPVTGVGR